MSHHNQDVAPKTFAWCMLVALAFVVGLVIGLVRGDKTLIQFHLESAEAISELEQELACERVAVVDGTERIHRLQKERNAFHAERDNYHEEWSRAMDQCADEQFRRKSLEIELADCRDCLNNTVPLFIEPVPEVPAPAPDPLTEVVIPVPKPAPVRCDCGCGKFDCKCACRKSK